MQSLDMWLEDDIPTVEPQLYQKDFTYKTKLITFQMHYRHKLISVEQLHKFMVSDDEKNHACTHGLTCANYGNCYSCPPIAPSFEKYNRKGYKNCLVYCFWTDWNFSINSTNPYFKLINANRTLSPYAWKYGQLLEQRVGGKDMIDGRCNLCSICKKKLEKPCAFPQERRSSLEAVGIDATQLCEAILEHKIQWYRKVNNQIIEPSYLTVVHGLLTNSEQPEEMLCLSL